jgi:cytochrome c
MLAGSTAVVAACAMSAKPDVDVRTPLAATLYPGATTGPQLPLHFDPNAKVILSNASNLPPASYAPSQAQRGAEVYQRTCALCHSGAQLIGEGFANTWNNRRVYDLYALVRSTMPLDNPGGLKDGEYLDVIAYLLQVNKHASAGPDSLKADSAAMRKLKISVGRG